MLYDVFISHAFEDKDCLVRPLAKILREKYIRVWYDEFSLKIGDSLTESINEGIASSSFGVVVFSKAFFQKKWTKSELNGLFAKMQGTNRILPIWHEVGFEYINDRYPILADIKASNSADGINRIATEIFNRVHPEGAPLVVAQDVLAQWGQDTPPVTDAYWLKVVEASNRSPNMMAAIPPNSIWGRWSFPLPEGNKSAKEWGEKIAWTAMQLRWTDAADETLISPISTPAQVIDFINAFPGLYDICKIFPDILAEYAPQLTIPGQGEDFERDFERLYQKSLKQHTKLRTENSTQGSGLTATGKCPCCDKEFLLRHPQFGEYNAKAVAHAYFHSGMNCPRVSPFEDFDHIIWLLSAKSQWLPEKIHSVLLEGLISNNTSMLSLCLGYKNKINSEIIYELLAAVDSQVFKWSKSLKRKIISRITYSVEQMKLPETPNYLFLRFQEVQLVERFISSQKEQEKDWKKQE